METTIGTGLATGSAGATAGADAARAALADLPGERVDFCQVFCSVDYEYEAVLEGIRDVIGEDAVLIGCSAAGPFTEAGTAEDGVAVSLVASDTVEFFGGIGTGLRENPSAAVREAVAEFPETVDGHPYLSAVVVHDGLADVGEELALATQQKLGPQVAVAGGSASDDLRYEATHVFHDDRALEDAVAIALIATRERPGIAFDHGHEPISDPIEVTRAEGSTVYEFDGRPAFEVWKDIVREPARERFGVEVDDLDPDGQRLFEVTAEFQFGIDQGDRYKIRWADHVPADEDGAIEFAIEVPEGTAMRVMRGLPERQVASAGDAARAALDPADETAYAGGFVYDCACRSTILGDRFPDAIDGIDDALGVPFAGFETLGELCMEPGQFSGFHNATTVVLLLPK